MLTSEEREALGVAGDHHPELCDCRPYVRDGGFAREDCCESLLETFATVEAIVARRVREALTDAADEVDRGPTFPLPPSIISTLLRERASLVAGDGVGM